MSLWWLSFADASLQAGEQSLGVVIVEAADIVSAARAAWSLGCNPGGEVKGMRIDPACMARLSFQLPTGVLIGPADARALADRIAAELAS